MKLLLLLFLGLGIVSAGRPARQMPYFQYLHWYNLPFYYPQADVGEQRNEEQPLFKSLQQDKGNENMGRFYIGSNIAYNFPTTNNYLIKTSYVFTTSTGTVCSLTSCIPAALFSAGSSNVLCRRKREAMLEQDIAPSIVQAVASTTIGDPNFVPVPEERQLHMSPYPIIESSIEETRESVKTKRFAFILTSIITSYNLLTSTYTITVSPVDGVAKFLACRPSGFTLC